MELLVMGVIAGMTLVLGTQLFRRTLILRRERRIEAFQQAVEDEVTRRREIEHPFDVNNWDVPKRFVPIKHP